MTDSGYETIRLETPGGETIVYFAPTFEVVPTDRNDILDSARGREATSVTRDNGLWTSELTVQGTFIHSDEVRPDFRDELQALHGSQTVTPQDQINRLRAFTVYAVPRNLHFYHRENEYRAATGGAVNPEGNVYPSVAVSELRFPEDGEVSETRTDFLVRMSIGVSRQSEPEAPDT